MVYFPVSPGCFFCLCSEFSLQTQTGLAKCSRRLRSAGEFFFRVFLWWWQKWYHHLFLPGRVFGSEELFVPTIGWQWGYTTGWALFCVHVRLCFFMAGQIQQNGKEQQFCVTVAGSCRPRFCCFCGKKKGVCLCMSVFLLCTFSLSIIWPLLLPDDNLEEFEGNCVICLKCLYGIVFLRSI